MRLSYWEKQRFFDKVDVCVIGSGIVGLSTAIELKRQRPDWKVLILEKGFLPYGASTRNAGFACFGSVTELMDDIDRMGMDSTLALVVRRWKGLLNLRQMLGDESIGLENYGGYELFDDRKAFEKAMDRVSDLNNRLKDLIGKEVYKDASPALEKFGFRGFQHSILNRYESQIDTGAMMHALLKLARKEGVSIFNGLGVEKVIPGEVHTTEDFVIETRISIVTTNGFARQLLPELDVDPARAQVLVTSPINNLPFKGTFHYDEGYYYFRNLGNRILLGGGRNLDFTGEKTTDMSQTKLIQERLEKLLFDWISPGIQPPIEHRWSGVMGVGEVRVPIVRRIEPGLYCAVRMGGMGVAIGTLVGKEAAEMIMSQSE